MLTAALCGSRHEASVAGVGRVSWYRDGPDGGGTQRPLILIHSVNAAASAYEVKPLYEYYRRTRTVYAIDLPGYGYSDRSDRTYTPRLMCDAIAALVAHVATEQRHPAVDAMALSLSCEFLARVACEHPSRISTVGLVSPTGFSGRSLRTGADGTTRGSALALGILNRPLYRRAVFGLLTRRAVIRYFLQRTWGSRDVDEGMVEYDYLTTRPPGAEHAPLHFLSGYLFSADSGTVYGAVRQPVWVVHGVRGDFVDYRGLALLSSRPNWTIETMQTGALPHFEQLAEFVRRYESWLPKQDLKK